jgi:hypothetical protein
VYIIDYERKETRPLRCTWSFPSTIQSNTGTNKSGSCVIPSLSYFHPLNPITDRKKVLKHHPDKKASSTSAPSPSPYSAPSSYPNTNTNDDAFFKCISKAFEVLYISPDRRRQFDSIDPYFDDDAPSAALFKGKTGEKLEALFFREFGPVFERESRFSKKVRTSSNT